MVRRDDRRHGPDGRHHPRHPEAAPDRVTAPEGAVDAIRPAGGILSTRRAASQFTRIHGGMDRLPCYRQGARAGHLQRGRSHPECVHWRNPRERRKTSRSGAHSPNQRAVHPADIAAQPCHPRTHECRVLAPLSDRHPVRELQEVALSTRCNRKLEPPLWPTRISAVPVCRSLRSSPGSDHTDAANHRRTR